MVPKEASNLAVHVGPDMAPTLSAHLSRPYSGILALCGCMYNIMSYTGPVMLKSVPSKISPAGLIWQKILPKLVPGLPF